MIGFARVLAVCSLVAALAATTPVVCWCSADEHGAQSFHALFAHSHAAPDAGRDDRSAGPEAPSWTASGGYGGGAWAGGVQLPLPVRLAATLPWVGDAVAEDARRPAEHRTPPAFPPPR